MSEIGTYVVDRTGWGPGPWDEEPDRVEWRTASGLVGLVVRSQSMGALCGYVGLPPGHALHGKDHDAIDGIAVHGGLTYSSACSDPICHVPAPGEPEALWWIGFDCGHAFDVKPAMMARLAKCGFPPMRFANMEEEYRPLPYVRACVEVLAAQVARGPAP